MLKEEEQSKIARFQARFGEWGRRIMGSFTNMYLGTFCQPQRDIRPTVRKAELQRTLKFRERKKRQKRSYVWVSD